MSLWVYYESLKDIDEIGSVEWISTNADDGWLTETDSCGLVDCLVSKGTWARDDTNITLLVDVARHNANLALTRLDDTGAVGAY
jgi:hypothetical protein